MISGREFALMLRLEIVGKGAFAPRKLLSGVSFGGVIAS